ncbi:hypothetical protein [Acinetobacter silvestris]|uniref:Heme biosynthesis protein HemY n=1 Tax=Acinetobacter silvestris TaxID=1977882 RepID=A0A1Y3CM10_9GAMM|nr:hypothetical protein [Acinetobacter silvestris]OTG67217.1 hypothetical protein B9T28_00855 [Acinetobacter silvestris]
MKQILLAYALVSLIIIAIMSVMSYGAGAGYVYLLWHGVQIQTNVWVVLFLIVVVSLFLQMSWLMLKRSIHREKRQLEQVLNFSHLHPYEQLGVIWILDGEEEQQAFVQQVFDQSGLLKQVVYARLKYQQNQYAEALVDLERSPASAFELAEIQRIEIYLAQNDAQQALTHLEFLNGHALSPWLDQVNLAYTQRMSELWGIYAVQFPWQYLHSTQFGQLNTAMKNDWLVQILGQFEQANLEEIELLQQRYIELAEHIATLSFDTRKLWLKVLSRLSEMGQQHQNLALQMLDEQFDQDVFYLWFQHQLLKQVPDYDALEQKINQFESKYPGMPVFSFAKWHIYIATGRMDEAKALLSLYPKNILMNYLRIKATFNGNEELIQQLNLVFEKDANFIQFKI